MHSHENIRVRMAPSPTGPFHIGTARTGLFNWLFARGKGGAFVLRVEDTDLERSDPAYEKEILEGFKWLGVVWDEGPLRQSERAGNYRLHIKKLLDDKKAYWCYCSKEELEAKRQAQLTAGLPPKYDGTCRKEAGESPRDGAKVIRFVMPEEEVTFTDLIRGDIRFNMGMMGDMAIAKNLETPLYNFAVVADDADMKITHVIRGEDHIANTPKQIMLQRALGFPTPQYAHLPLILNSDRSKLSKRFADVSLLGYRDRGFLPEALVNFMAYLGWHPKDEKEVMNIEELIKEFSLERVQKAGAIFNEEKLLWLNGAHMRRMEDAALAERATPFFEARYGAVPQGALISVIRLEKERAKTLVELAELGSFFFALPDYTADLLVTKGGTRGESAATLHKLTTMLDNVPAESFEAVSLTELLMPHADKEGRGKTLWPLRAALSGLKASPGPFDIMEVLGKKETMRRLALGIKKLE